MHNEQEMHFERNSTRLFDPGGTAAVELSAVDADNSPARAVAGRPRSNIEPEAVFFRNSRLPLFCIFSFLPYFSASKLQTVLQLKHETHFEVSMNFEVESIASALQTCSQAPHEVQLSTLILWAKTDHLAGIDNRPPTGQSVLQYSLPPILLRMRIRPADMRLMEIVTHRNCIG